MTLKIGDRIRDRFEVIEKSPVQEDLLRFIGIDHHTGEHVELLCPSAKAKIRFGNTQHFETSHKNQNPPPVWQGTLSNTPVAIYTRCNQSLAALPKISIDNGMHALQSLLGDLRNSPNAFPEGIRPRDLVVNQDQHLKLQTSGIIPDINKARPEIYQSEGTPLQKSLYSLGWLIFCMLTPPPKIASRSDFEAISQSPPRLSEFYPHVDPNLVELLSILMSSQPEHRELALQKYAEVPPFVLESLPQPSVPVESSPQMVSQPQSHVSAHAHRDIPLPNFLVFCSEKSIPLEIARRVAAIAQLDPIAITSNSDQIPLAGADTQSEAEKMAQTLSDIGLTTRVQPKNKAPNPLLVLGSGLGLGAVSFFFNFWIGILFVLLGFAGALASGLYSANKAQKYYTFWNEVIAPRGMHPSLLSARTETQNVRRHIMASSLGDIAKMDLHSAIDEIDDIIDDHHQSNTPLSQQLQQEIASACAELSQTLKDESTASQIGLNIRKKSKLIQSVANQMRSL